MNYPIPDEPKVYACMPAYDGVVPEAAFSHYTKMCSDKVKLIPAVSSASLLCFGFNKHWASAVYWAKNKAIDYFFMHHADIEATTPFFLDELIKEMHKHQAAVVSVVQPIKDNKQKDTSTAVESCINHWVPRRLTFTEIYNMPETFTMPGLLVNTGMMLVDLRRPEFQEINNGELYFKFQINDRIVQAEDGTLRAQVQPEDWNFSRLCHSRKLPICATRKIQCFHYGKCAFSNQPIVKGDEAKVEKSYA